MLDGTIPADAAVVVDDDGDTSDDSVDDCDDCVCSGCCDVCDVMSDGSSIVDGCCTYDVAIEEEEGIEEEEEEGEMEEEEDKSLLCFRLRSFISMYSRVTEEMSLRLIWIIGWTTTDPSAVL